MPSTAIPVTACSVAPNAGAVSSRESPAAKAMVATMKSKATATSVRRLGREAGAMVSGGIAGVVVFGMVAPEGMAYNVRV